mgnify:CR=1 FL=1
MAVQAQVWTAPAVPGEDLSTLKQTDIVYVYNVEADAFIITQLRIMPESSSRPLIL